MGWMDETHEAHESQNIHEAPHGIYMEFTWKPYMKILHKK